MKIFRVQRAMEAHKIGLPEKGCLICKNHPFHLVPFGMAVGCDHLHSKGQADGGHGPSDAAQPYDAKGLPFQFRDRDNKVAEITASYPVAVPDTVCIEVYLVRVAENKGKHKLGHRMGRIGGHVGDCNMPLSGSLYIRHVIAGSHYAYILKPR